MDPNGRGAAGRIVVWSGLLAVALSGCTAMRGLKQPTDYIESVHPKLVRVTQSNGTKFFMTAPRVMRGMLMGFVKHPPDPVAEFEAVPFSAITRVEAQEPTPYRTVGIVVGLGVGIGIVGEYLYQSSKGSNGPGAPPDPCIAADEC
jgi:hypothetical protein